MKTIWHDIYMYMNFSIQVYVLSLNIYVVCKLNQHDIVKGILWCLGLNTEDVQPVHCGTHFSVTVLFV